MTRLIAIAVILVGAGLATTSAADAAPRGRIRLFARSYSPNGPIAFGAPTYPSNYGTRYRPPTAEELYPKYYGSFHYRHLDNIGIPHGDIGFRGNGIYMSPW